MKTNKTIIVLCCLLSLVGCATTNLGKGGYVSGPITDYEEITNISNIKGWTAYEGFCTLDGYAYSAKVASSNNGGVLLKTDLKTGEIEYLNFVQDDGTITPYTTGELGHANDICAVKINGKVNLFIGTLIESSKVDAVVRVEIQDDGTSYKIVGTYGAAGLFAGVVSAVKVYGIDILDYSNSTITFVIKNGTSIYTGTLSDSATDGRILLKKAADLYVKSVPYVDGDVNLNFNDYDQQGLFYYNGELFVPFTKRSTYDHTYLVIYKFDKDTTTEDGYIYAESGRTMYFEDYVDEAGTKFEIESLGYDAKTSTLYFNTNRNSYEGYIRDGILKINYPL